MAAGLGFIEFTTGDVLSAAAANGYLASQSVMVFATAAARTTAITSPQQGMISFLKDSNTTQFYTGAAWSNVDTGASPLTTKGDIYGYSTTNARLGVGANNTVLTADSTQATGIKWAAAANGKLIQIINASTTTSTSVASTTYTDSTLTASITPTLATSQVFIIYSQSLAITRTAADINGGIRLLRGATSIQDLVDACSANFATTFVYQKGLYTASYLDSPATTSATTYKVQVKANVITSGGSVIAQDGSARSTITLIEIGA